MSRRTEEPDALQQELSELIEQELIKPLEEKYGFHFERFLV